MCCRKTTNQEFTAVNAFPSTTFDYEQNYVDIFYGSFSMKRGCRGSGNSSKKRLKAGSFFSQILDILTTHETSKVARNQRTCIR